MFCVMEVLMVHRWRAERQQEEERRKEAGKFKDGRLPRTEGDHVRLITKSRLYVAGSRQSH
jgi:hypothetical protein